MADSKEATEIDVEALLREHEEESESEAESEEEMGSNLQVAIPGHMSTAVNNEEDGSSDEEEGEEMEVLDPNHPLMQRVQQALQDQLTRQNEKLQVELNENLETLKAKKTERESLGVELYGLQQQLARQQMLLEKEQDQVSALHQVRNQKEKTLQDVTELYRTLQEQLKIQRKNSENLRSEVDTLRTKLMYVTSAHDTVRTDIAVTKRATEKATVDLAKAQGDKQKQDLYVDRLTEEGQRLEEDVGLYKVQCTAQSQETREVKEALREAAMELEMLELEKKQLYQQWANSLLAMQRRDEAFSAMRTALSMQKDKSVSMDTEIESYKKAVLKEQERSEQLTGMLRKLEADIAHVKKQIETSQSRREQLKMEYMVYTRTLQETEQALNKATTDCALKQNELKALRTLIEREALEKHKLEDAVMEKILSQLTMDKATQHTRKTMEKMRQRVKQVETDLTKTENENSALDIQLTDYESKLEYLQKLVDKQNTAIEKQNALISKSETEIARNNNLIERKQTQIDQLNKKLSMLMSKIEGGEETGPMEVRIKELENQIQDSLDRCVEMEQHWLRQKSELVKKTREADEQEVSVERLNREMLILEQKKLRLDDEVCGHEKEIREVNKGIESLHKDIVKLNALITHKRGEEESLQQGNILVEGDFVATLKEAELESIRMQSTLEQLKEEKGRLQNSILEAEKQIFLWERKIQLAKEMRKAVDSDEGQAEIRGMKSEIHRMEVHHAELMRKQEQLIQEMEKAVYRREAIISKGEVQIKTGKAESTRGHMKKKIEEAKKKIKQTTESTSFCDQEMRNLRMTQTALGEQLEEKKTTCRQLQTVAQALEAEVEQLAETKQQNFNEILAYQQRVKHLQSAKDGHYRMSIPAHQEREAELQRQQERLYTLLSISDRLAEDFPHAGPALRKVHHLAQWKMTELERTRSGMRTPSERSVELA